MVVLVNGICAFQVNGRYQQRTSSNTLQQPSTTFPINHHHVILNGWKVNTRNTDNVIRTTTKLYFSPSTTKQQEPQPPQEPNDDPAEVEYRQTLKEAQIALEKVEKAKQKLLTKKQSSTGSDTKIVKLSQP